MIPTLISHPHGDDKPRLDELRRAVGRAGAPADARPELGPLDAAMVRGVESGHRIIEFLLDELEHAMATPHDNAARARADILMATLDQFVPLVDSMFETLKRRMVEQERLQACHSSRAELARCARVETRVWARLEPVRAEFATELRSGVDFGAALVHALQRRLLGEVDRPVAALADQRAQPELAERVSRACVLRDPSVAASSVGEG